jgi:putative DNA primase/helicase
VGELDRLVCANSVGESAEDAGQGRRFEFEPIEPWHKEVTASSLLNELSATFARYLILPPHGATTLSLWAMHTYLMDEFSTDPYLGFTSPEKRCGKSRALTLLSLTCHRPVLGGNITPSALYRVIDAHAPALLIDELDTFLKDVELRGILNAGYTRSTAFVTRCVGDDHDPRQFAVWGAKAFGLIGKLHGTLEDRTIIIRMRRKKKDERVERLREKDKASFKHLRQKCLRFAHDNRLRIREAEPELPDEINDRAQDIWEPLFAIATLAGSVWIEKAKKAAIALSGQIDIDADSIRVQLLADIYQAFKDKAVEWLSSTELVDTLTAIEDHPWCEFNKGKPLTAKGLKNLLAAFDVKPTKERASNGYHVAQFEDSFSRYLPDSPPLSSTSSTSQAQSGFEENSHIPQNENGGTCKNGGNPHGARPVEDVEHRDGIHRGGEHLKKVTLDE